MEISKLLLAFVISIAISMLVGTKVIPMLKRLKAGQSIREEGPSSHLVKSGTPTMGGVIFITSLLIVNIIMHNFHIDILMVFFATLGFGGIGFIDDYIKVVKKRNLGLTAKGKLLLQIIVAVILLFYQYQSSTATTDIFVIGIKRIINIGALYTPFIIFVTVGTVNSVNLTDGLDGLASGVTLIYMIFISIISYKIGRYDISLFSLSLAGALVGFLYFNKYPAKVFMGDMGSLALGGAVASTAILLNQPLILPVAGGVFFIETLSVIIQVISFKTRGKRIFLMSPLHHHFEEKGWKETKVVGVFYLMEVILCILSYVLIF